MQIRGEVFEKMGGRKIFALVFALVFEVITMRKEEKKGQILPLYSYTREITLAVRLAPFHHQRSRLLNKFYG